jgi:hypothetical protein
MSQVRPKAERVGEIAAKAVRAAPLLDRQEFHGRKAPGVLPARGGRGGTQQRGVDNRATFLQSAAGPCRPSAENYQRGGFASPCKSLCSKVQYSLDPGCSLTSEQTMLKSTLSVPPGCRSLMMLSSIGMLNVRNRPFLEVSPSMIQAL